MKLTDFFIQFLIGVIFALLASFVTISDYFLFVIIMIITLIFSLIWNLYFILMLGSNVKKDVTEMIANGKIKKLSQHLQFYLVCFSCLIASLFLAFFVEWSKYFLCYLVGFHLAQIIAIAYQLKIIFKNISFVNGRTR